MINIYNNLNKIIKGRKSKKIKNRRKEKIKIKRLSLKIGHKNNKFNK